MSEIRKPGNCCPPSVVNAIRSIKKTAEGCYWGHSLDSFFSVQPADSEHYSWSDVWTTSTLEKLGVGPFGTEQSGPREPAMRIRRPWPVLKVPRGKDALPSLGIIDPGSDHDDDEEGAGENPLLSPLPHYSHNGPVDVDPYLLEGIPKLEEFIPKQYLPKILCIHDPDSRLSGTEQRSSPVYYKRIFPTIEIDQVAPKESLDEISGATDRSALPNVGHLYIKRESRVGCGHHSNVYRATFRLPASLGANSSNGLVSVVAKVSVARREAREFLYHEAASYDSLPEHLAQESCGYALAPGIRYPVPVGAVVPKFFGYYIPEYSEYDATRPDEPSAICLLEECGDPIDPAKLSHDEKAECFSMFLRLHLSGFLQQSAFRKNILVQPGPLTTAPSARSIASPSFRIIDFGRAMRRPAGTQKEWLEARETEVRDVQKVLRIPRHSMS